MRYLGLDVGRKTIGVAVGGAIAAELTTIPSPKDKSFYEEVGQRNAFSQLEELAKLEEVNAFVIGLPVKEDGTASEESVKIENFGRGLEEATGNSVYFVDETLTSFMARDILESQGVDQANIDRRVHQLSAQLILQQYLEENALT